MARKPKPYIKDGFYRTSIGGVQHRRLCPVEDGMRKAEVALARLIVRLADTEQTSGAPTDLAPRPKYPTVQEALNAFMKFKKSEAAAGTYSWYQDKLWPLYERFVGWPVNKLTPDDGVNYKAWLREKTWRKGKHGALRTGLGNATVNQHIRAARTFLDWCCKPSRRHEYGMTMNPWEEIKYLPEKPRERVISDEEFAHLLDQCKDGNTRGAAQEMREQLLTLRHTTMRPQELRALKWDYIHWDAHRIVYPATVTKTRQRREVSMIPVVEATLAERKRRLEAMGLRLAGRYVFPADGHRDGVREAGRGDRPQSAAKLSQRFRRLVDRCVREGLIEKEKAGERIVPYSTRHTRITEMSAEGVDVSHAMREAGHTNPRTTERYKHLAGSQVTEDVRQKSKAKLPTSGSAGSPEVASSPSPPSRTAAPGGASDRPFAPSSTS